MEGQRRRLAAIVAADVVGYSRMMGADETGTLAALKKALVEEIEPRICTFHGRVVKTTGDGLLAEFPSVVDAVLCVVDMQRAMAAHNQDVLGDRCIVFRMGINLGDIIAEGNDIFGDGVNVAARLQAIAPPGGVCVSGRVRDEVRDRLDVSFEDAGEQSLKNIARPVRVWRWSPGAVIAAAKSTLHVSQVARALAQKPSVGVLPFINLSGDPEQDYFTDGVTEDIITALSRFHELLTAPRSSTFAFKGETLDVAKIARQIGVQYLLTGSMRVAGKRIRVTAELAHCESGTQLWRDRYDRDLTDVFELQDELSRSVAAVVLPALRDAEVEQARRKASEDLTAYDLYLRALPHMWAGTKEEIPNAITLLRQSLQYDAASVATLSALSWSLFMAAPLGAAPPGEALSEAFQHARRAVEVDAGDAFAQAVYSLALGGISSDYDQIALHAEEAVRLNPSSSFAWGILGFASNSIGRFEHALESFGLAVRLSPRDTFLYFWLAGLAAAYFALERYDEGVGAARKAVLHNPNFGTAHRLLAANLALTQRIHEAREVTQKRDIVQKTSLGELRVMGLFRQEAILERYLAAHRLCGMDD
jgi:TolB-like protein/class 3 adenylate cyclase